VSYYSNGWTQNCIRSLRKHISDVDILVVDNNPTSEDAEYRAKSFLNCTNSVGDINKKDIAQCEIERRCLRRVNRLKTILTPIKLSHGYCLNLAINYAYNHGYKYLAHIEPDCIVKGNVWFKNLLESMHQNFWMAGGTKLVTGHLHPTPSIWNVKYTNKFDFDVCLLSKHKNEPDFAKLYKLEFVKKPFFKQERTINFYQQYFDTGVEAWYTCAKNNKAQHVESPDLIHLWAKSSTVFSGLFY
jgi:hypothetical protein